MSYCLNPQCSNPENAANNKFCITCGSRLLLGDRYRAIKILGQGGMGRTFLAKDEFKPSQPYCVIKQFYPESNNQKEKAAELFRQEAIRLEQLGKHPQIPELYAYFEQDRRQYIIQEFIAGENLAEELKTKGAFCEQQIWSLLRDLIPVLKFIHQGQVIHRDIKPENIIRSANDGKLVLIDFGAAKFATAASLGSNTVIGSAEYVAPEQLIGKANFASDIYSLGMTCIYLLTRVPPFQLIDTQSEWRQVLIDNSIGEKLAKILDRTIAYSLDERWKSAQEILDALEEKYLPVTNSNFSFCRCLHTLTNHSDRVRAIAFSSDGELLVSGSWDRTVKLWQVEKGLEIWTYKVNTFAIDCVAFNPDGKIIAIAGKDNKIKILETATGKEIFSLKGHKGFLTGINSLAFSPDGEILVSGGGDKNIKIWRINTKEEIRTLTGHLKWISAVAISPDGEIIASSSTDKTVKLWQLKTGIELHNLRGHLGFFAGINGICFSFDGKLLATASDDYSIKLWDVKTGKELQQLTNHSGFVLSVSFSPDGKLLASSGEDKTIKLWQLSQEKEKGILSLTGHSDSIHCVIFSPDGKTLASSSDDKTIKIWRY